MKNVIFIGLLTIGLAACNDSGSEYVGHWEQVGKDCSTMDIEKNGESLLVKVQTPGMFGRESAAMPGVMNGDTLNVTVRGTIQAMVINHNTESLLVASDEYKRVTGPIKDCTPAKAKTMTLDELYKKSLAPAGK